MALIRANSGSGGTSYTQIKKGVYYQINSNTSITINCGFAPKLVIIGAGTQSIYERLYILSDDGTQNIMIGNNGNTEYNELATNDITISGNDVIYTFPLYWGSYARISYMILG